MSNNNTLKHRLDEVREINERLGASKTPNNMHEFSGMYRSIDFAVKNKSIKDLKSIKARIRKAGISSEYQFENAVDHLIAAYEILYGKS